MRVTRRSRTTGKGTSVLTQHRAKTRTVLFVKGRSYNKLDLLDFFKRKGRLTIGYIAWCEIDRASPVWNEWSKQLASLSSHLLLPSEAVATVEFGDRDDSRIIKLNARLQNEVRPGDFVVIPRPASGRFYVGRIGSDFTIFQDDPSTLFEEHEKSTIAAIAEEESAKNKGNKNQELCNLYGQVLQGWQLEKLADESDGPMYLQEVPLFLVPSIIRKSMASRRSHGRVSIPGEAQYANLVASILDGFLSPSKERVTLHSLVQRLQHDLTPSSFEHLCVDLLNCEQPERHWIHVGGAGDGGIDGAGFNRVGKLVAVLQCKYQANTTPKKLVTAIRKSLKDMGEESVEIVIASLWDGGAWDTKSPFLEKGGGVLVWRGSEIAGLCNDHKDKIAAVSAMIRWNQQVSIGTGRSPLR